MSGLVEGKVALVTGASSGIGVGIAKVLAREGADIAVHYNRNRAGAEATAEAIRQTGRGTCVVQADIAIAADVERLFARVVETFGCLDILVNNAGITPRMDFLETDASFFDTMIGTDLKGTFLCSRRAAEIMKGQGGGRIVSISSVHDKLTSHEFSLYAAAKGGVSRLTAGMAVDLADYGITVNAISPGWVPVEQEGTYPERLFEAFCAHTPLKRPGTPQDVGELAAFLASDRAGWLTGQVIHLDGGTSCMINMPSRRRDRDIYEL